MSTQLATWIQFVAKFEGQNCKWWHPEIAGSMSSKTDAESINRSGIMKLGISPGEAHEISSQIGKRPLCATAHGHKWPNCRWIRPGEDKCNKGQKTNVCQEAGCKSWRWRLLRSPSMVCHADLQAAILALKVTTFNCRQLQKTKNGKKTLSTCILRKSWTSRETNRKT